MQILALQQRRRRQLDPVLGHEAAGSGAQAAAKIVAFGQGQALAEYRLRKTPGCGGSEDHLIDVIERVRQRRPIAAPPGLDRRQLQILAQEAPAQARQKWDHGGRLQHAAAERVRDGDVAAANRIQQTRNAQRRIGTQLQGIAEIIVQAPQDDVDTVQAAQRLQIHAAVAHRQIAPIDQLVTEVLRQERLLEVGGVVGAGAEQHDARIVAIVGRQRRQGLAHRSEEQRQPLDVALAKYIRKHARNHDAVFERIARSGRRLRAVVQNAPFPGGGLTRSAAYMCSQRPCGGSIPAHGRRNPGCPSTISGGSQPSPSERRGP